ncbi:DUF3667 domain-containing protein [Pontibacter diazotrophicus]|uniref:DUF3667 domain-containing protein n=1 Tax=Pontibacter diazotrophicus TaxID=1400979 RepID=UPI001FE94AAA|nr:DUF3667 domain-containing protein [Pontibacter diazotrophicus]
MRKNRRKFTQCPNCGYSFEEVNNYCPNCGQENHDLNVPVKHLIVEFLEGTIHYDTKTWRTIKYLLFRPGLLTEKFNIGQRAAYVPPFRLYVFVSIVFFFVLALSTNAPGVGTDQKEVQVTVPGVHIEDPLTDSVLYTSEPAVVTSEAQAIAVSDSALQAIEDPTFKTAMTRLVSFSKGGEQAKQKLLKNTSFMMFILMPFFAYLLYLFYYKQRRNYVEHLMFSIHLHTFFFVIIIIATSLALVFSGLDLEGWVVVLMLVYLFFALKQVYKQSYGQTLLKLIPLSFLYCLTLAIFLLGTLAVSVMMS